MNERFNEEEYDDDDDENYEYYDEEYPVPVEFIDKWKRAEFGLQESQMNLVVLDQTVKMLSDSVWWRFKTLNSKIKAITKTYQAISHLIDPNDVYSS